MMNRNTPIVVYLLFMALVPVYLAVNQGVPTQFVTQQAVLLLSLAAFGLVLGQFWLSRLLPPDVTKVKPAVVLRGHKVVGYAAGAFLLLHPVLIVARRFWAQESDPIDNLLLILGAPAMLPAIVAWVLLALLVLLSLLRRRLRPKSWGLLHGLMSAAFVGLATWHVVSVGRHSSAAMSLFWIALAGSAVGTLLLSYLPVHSTHNSKIHNSEFHNSKISKGVVHEFPR